MASGSEIRTASDINPLNLQTDEGTRFSSKLAEEVLKAYGKEIGEFPGSGHPICSTENSGPDAMNSPDKLGFPKLDLNGVNGRDLSKGTRWDVHRVPPPRQPGEAPDGMEYRLNPLTGKIELKTEPPTIVNDIYRIPPPRQPGEAPDGHEYRVNPLTGKVELKTEPTTVVNDIYRIPPPRQPGEAPNGYEYRINPRTGEIELKRELVGTVEERIIHPRPKTNDIYHQKFDPPAIHWSPRRDFRDEPPYGEYKKNLQTGEWEYRNPD